ncbi:MAG: hypothetical protein GY853_10880 [PVC group bacterium]|nr:hypothetical protein [PVC group bacterium]
MSQENKLKFKSLFGIVPEEFPDTLIISPFFSLKSFKSELENAENFKGMVFKGVVGAYKDKKIAFVNTGMGHTLVGDCVLAQQITNVSKIIFLGAVGAVNGLNVGDCVLVQKAFFDTEYYEKLGVFGQNKNEIKCFIPDPELVDKIDALAKEQKKEIKKIDVMSVHSFWNEDEVLVNKLKDASIHAVELECAIFYALSSLNQIKSLALCFVSDHVVRRPYWSDFSPAEQAGMRESREFMVKASLEMAYNIL